MRVERATEDDLEGILAVDAAHMGTAREAFLEAAVKKRECYVAREGEDVIGFAVLNRAFFGEYFIDLLIVHPQQRRKGVGRSLMRRIEALVPSEKLFTSTNQSNAPMQALCEALGYTKSGWVENLDEGDPEIIYFKRVNHS
jgi:ribosomal protein S18 acetylase RimI-like enzyme